MKKHPLILLLLTTLFISSEASTLAGEKRSAQYRVAFNRLQGLQSNGDLDKLPPLIEALRDDPGTDDAESLKLLNDYFVPKQISGLGEAVKTYKQAVAKTGKDLSESIGLLRTCLEQHPDFEYGHALLSKYYMFGQNQIAAKRHIDIANRLAPRNILVLEQRLAMAKDMGNSTEAQTIAQSWLKMDPYAMAPKDFLLIFHDNSSDIRRLKLDWSQGFKKID